MATLVALSVTAGANIGVERGKPPLIVEGSPECKTADLDFNRPHLLVHVSLRSTVGCPLGSVIWHATRYTHESPTVSLGQKLFRHRLP
ncbi:hypothetical protein H6P81_004796 [Aristolochia fimbriata]|uniref:Uncharacterized protein n=1 Tax=Aristolochia fimbriata TaxID=158543 RepID=A0AAV7EW85_ARIFI|nr:hypothetical protein H6P81_004796 [Aristolochia fimbriata]